MNTYNAYYIDGDYSVENLMRLLKRGKREKFLYPITANAKIAAVNVVLNSGILTESELADVRTFNVEAVLTRFHKENPGRFPAPSWQSYCSRVRSSIKILKEYNTNPEKYSSGSYEPTPARRHRQLNRASTLSQSASAEPSARQTSRDEKTFTLPVPIRGGQNMVLISGIPVDINKEDANRISAMVLALGEGQPPLPI